MPPMLDFFSQPFVLATKYSLPAKVRGIWTNPAWRVDNSRSLWQVIHSSPKADEITQTSLEPEWILVTPPRSGVFVDHEETTREEDGRPEIRELYIVDARVILRIIPWTSEGDSMKTLGSRILVRPDSETSKTESGLYKPETTKRRPTTGVVVDVGPDVEDSDLTEDVRILYSLYAGTDLEIGGERHVILEADQAQLIIHDGEEVAVT